MDAASFRYSKTATDNRLAKAKTLARFLWDRDINGVELLEFSDAHRRRIARAAGVNPPSSLDTWNTVVQLIEQKFEWVERNPEHPAGFRNELDDRENWHPEPVKPPRKAREPKASSAGDGA